MVMVDSLLGILSLLHIGTAVLAVRRNSSSPDRSYCNSSLVVDCYRENDRRDRANIMIANDLNEHNGMVHLEPLLLAIYLSLSSVLSVSGKLKDGR